MKMHKSLKDQERKERNNKGVDKKFNFFEFLLSINQYYHL